MTCDNWVVLKIQPEASGEQDICEVCNGKGLVDAYSTWEEPCTHCEGHGKEPNGVFYKLLQGFSGSYTYGNSWHMNSGIERVVKTDGVYEVFGYSGSVYKVPEGSYGVRMNISGVIDYYEGRYPNCIKVMPDCDWSEFKFK